MRIAQVSYTNEYQITYPEEYVWLGDNNVIKVESTDGNTAVGAEITITRTNDGVSRTIRHCSELHYIVFNLNDLLLNIYNGGMTYDVTVKCLNWGIYDGQIRFGLKILKGKSFTNRSHGAERTIYTYNLSDLNKLQLWCHKDGVISCGTTNYTVHQGYNALNLDNVITHSGDYTLCFFAQSVVPLLAINTFNVTTSSAKVELSLNNTTAPTTNATKGDIWSDSKFTTNQYCIDLHVVESCSDFDVIKLRYYNTDGMLRYIAGKIMSETIDVKTELYKQFDLSVYRNIPRRYMTANDRKIKIVFDDIQRDAYLSDILLSDSVQFLNYDGEWYDCVIANSAITATNEDSEDYELEVILNNE